MFMDKSQLIFELSLHEPTGEFYVIVKHVLGKRHKRDVV